MSPPHHGDKLTFHNVQHQPRVFIGVEEDHIPQGAIGERRAQHWDVILGGEGGNVVTPRGEGGHRDPQGGVRTPPQGWTLAGTHPIPSEPSSTPTQGC